MTAQVFIATIAPFAVRDWRERRIMLPSIQIAQGMKESGLGTSELAQNAKALYGIKLNGWTGKTYRKKADEMNADGTMRTDPDALWRAYDSWEESTIDHNTYIAERKVGNQKEPNFKEVVGETNLKKALAGLVGNANRSQVAARCTDAELKKYVLAGKTQYGYATGHAYVQSLLDDYIIKYNLTQYDNIEEDKNVVKIALDAGHGLKTAGKQTPDGIKEWSINDKVRDKVVKHLSAYNVEIIHTDNDEGNTDEGLSTRLNKYVSAGVKAFVSIHHNALTGSWNSATGVEVYTDKNPTANDTKLANCVYNKLVAYTGLKGRGVKQANFAVINQNQIPAILVEGGFMDSSNDYKYITSDAGQEAYAKAVADGLVKFLGLSKSTATTTPPQSNDKLYRVQLGAYRNKVNAENLMKKAKEAGFDVFLKEE